MNTKIFYPDKKSRDERIKNVNEQIKILTEENELLVKKINTLLYEVQLLNGMNNLELYEQGKIDFNPVKE
jgi:hypothetical protein